MESLELIQYFLDNLNYWTIILLMAIESSFIPFPSEIVVPPAAYQAAAEGDMNIVLIIVFATIGACIGAIINYILALYLGRPIVYAFANSRLGRLCLLDETKIQRAEQFFDRHGAISTLVGRLVPAVRQLISIPAGLARMNFLRFITFTAIGAGAWNTILAAIGYYLHSVVPKEELMTQVALWSGELKWAMIVLGISLVGYLVWQARK